MVREQLGELIRREYRRMVHYVRRQIHFAADMDAEDIVQDVVAGLLEQVDPMLPLENLAGYLYRSLRNRVIDYFRTLKPMISMDQENPDQPGSGLKNILKDRCLDPLAAAGQSQLETVLYNALARLKPIEREVVVANELEGISFRELSEAWEIPVNTLISHKARALGKLRRYVAPID